MRNIVLFAVTFQASAFQFSVPEQIDEPAEAFKQLAINGGCRAPAGFVAGCTAKLWVPFANISRPRNFQSRIRTFCAERLRLAAKRQYLRIVDNELKNCLG